MTTQTRSALAPATPAAAATVAAGGPQDRPRIMSLAGECWTAVPVGADLNDPARPLLVCLTGDGRTLYPCWQFDADNRPRLELAPAVGSLVAAGVSGWMIAAWLMTPCDDLAGSSPDAVLSDPSGDHEAVYRLAAAYEGAASSLTMHRP